MDTHGSSALPPQPPPEESFARCYKFLWPMLVAVNLAVGVHYRFQSTLLINGCIFLHFGNPGTKKKDEHIEEEGATPVSISASKTAPIAEKTLHSPSVRKPVTLQEPIPED
uniref:Uncharacterized protein n=1 Tax=Quercus lobata TaxID=97700 RepID=A0A7N2QXM9_QUELO